MGLLTHIIGLIAAVLIANGEATNAGFGGTIASSAIENNSLSHDQVLLLEAELKQCLLHHEAIFEIGVSA